MKKYQVFVSSTYEDLRDERLAAINTLLDNNCIPVGMEQFPASGLGIMEYIQKVLINCDYYILILAGRYGSVDVDGIGFTEKEFDYAKAQSIPTLVFCNKNIDNLPLAKSEKSDSERELLAKFREKAKKGTLISYYYYSASDLSSKIATAINRAKEDTPRPGWIRALDETKSGKKTESNYERTSCGSFVSVRMQESNQPLFLAVFNTRQAQGVPPLGFLT